MTVNSLFEGHVPVAPDVDILLAAFGRPEPGREFTHQEVSDAVGLGVNTNRYRSVTASWMKRLWSDFNIRVVGINTKGGGFRTLYPGERLNQSEKQRERGTRALKRSLKEVVTTPREQLTDHEQHRREHLLRTSALMLMAVKEHQTDYSLSLTKSPDSLPRAPRPTPST